MSAMQTQLEALRRDVDALRGEMRELAARSRTSDSADAALTDACLRFLQEELAQHGKTAGIGIFRVTVEQRAPGDIHTSFGLITCGDVGELPRAKKPRPSIVAGATDDRARQAIRRLAEPFFDGQPMRRTKADLATALGISETEVEEALRPLVEDDLLRWNRTSAGDETYEILNTDVHALMLLALE